MTKLTPMADKDGNTIGQSFELLQQQPRALPASGERREECERVDDTPLTYAEGAERGEGGNEQIFRAQNECDRIRERV